MKVLLDECIPRKLVVSIILCKRGSPSWEGFDFRLRATGQSVRASGWQIGEALHAILGRYAT
jgi:hypothetical protein